MTWVGQRLDAGEELEVITLPFGQALELALGDEVIDSALMLGLLLTAQKGLAPEGPG